MRPVPKTVPRTTMNWVRLVGIILDTTRTDNNFAFSHRKYSRNPPNNQPGPMTNSQLWPFFLIPNYYFHLMLVKKKKISNTFFKPTVVNSACGHPFSVPNCLLEITTVTIMASFSLHDGE